MDNVIFTVADGLKYIELLNKKLSSIEQKIRQVENVKITQKVVSSGTATNIVEQTEYTINPKELYGEFDSVAKEIRLVKQAIERVNHTVDLGFTPKY